MVYTTKKKKEKNTPTKKVNEHCKTSVLILHNILDFTYQEIE